MNTTLYKNEVNTLKELAQNIESHKPQSNAQMSAFKSKDIASVIGIIGAVIIAMVALLTWWLRLA